MENEDIGVEILEEVSGSDLDVSDGDSVSDSDVSVGDVSSGSVVVVPGSLSVEDVTAAIEGAEIQAVVSASSGDLFWEKPLEDYTVSEGLLLILVLCAVGTVIDKIIGGVLNCKSLLKK